MKCQTAALESPVAPDERGTSGAIPLAGRSVPAPRLLVLEDDEDLRNVFCRIARSLDPAIVVDWARTLGDAVSLLGAHRYSAVIADYLLPGTLTGLALRAHSRRRQPGATFAMMSAYPLKDMLAMLRPQPCPFLPKPFSVVDCREFLEDLLFPHVH